MRKTQIIGTGLDLIRMSGLHRLLRPVFGGLGLIVTLHRVRPPRDEAFQPNAHLEVEPVYLSELVKRLRASAVDLVSLDEVQDRLLCRKQGRRFVAFTFDDGYRDTLEFAYPILRRHGVPFAVFVTAGFADRTADMWWLALEEVVRKVPTLALEIDNRPRMLECPTAEEKDRVFAAVYWWLRDQDEPTLRRVVRDLALRYGVDPTGGVATHCMDWQDIATLARDPLVTIGAHSITHPRLRKLSEREATVEIGRSADIIAAALGARPRHFAYPVGDPTSAGPREFALTRDLGFATAVTMRRGVVFPEHRDHLHALPRVSLSGLYQEPRFFEVLRSGLPYAVANRFRRLNVG